VIARNTDGPVISSELFVIVDLPKISTNTGANVPIRGVSPQAKSVRGNIKIEQGRMFGLGRNEMIAGAGAARAFKGLKVGNKLRINKIQWTIVGIFSGGGGAAESEIWTDAKMLQ